MVGFFDHYAKERMKVKGYVRYMDDVLLFADTMEEIKTMLHAAKRFLEDELLLTLKEETIDTTFLLLTLLQIDGVDARSVQKTPAGVLVVRRGLFFVKRQRRCAVYLQKKKKRLKKHIKQYRYRFETNMWNEE